MRNIVAWAVIAIAVGIVAAALSFMLFSSYHQGMFAELEQAFVVIVSIMLVTVLIGWAVEEVLR